MTGSIDLKGLILFLTVFLITGTAKADEAKTHEFETGVEVSHITYKEDVMKEKGVMTGITGAYTYSGHIYSYKSTSILKVDGRVAYGQLNYDGALSSGAPYTIDNIDNYIIELRGITGHNFKIADFLTITPYFGLGYRYLNDDISKDPAGYKRESNYFYGPVGVEFNTELNKGWSIGTAFEYDIFFSGKQKSHLSDVVSGLNDIENDQKKGHGYRASLKIMKETEKVSLLIEPFIRYWDIDESEETYVTYAGSIIGIAFEPENHSTEWGVKLGIKF